MNGVFSKAAMGNGRLGNIFQHIVYLAKCIIAGIFQLDKRYHKADERLDQ